MLRPESKDAMFVARARIFALFTLAFLEDDQSTAPQPHILHTDTVIMSSDARLFSLYIFVRMYYMYSYTYITKDYILKCPCPHILSLVVCGVDEKNARKQNMITNII